MNITFIGLGAMGVAMVERLLLACYTVTVFNRTPKKAEQLIRLGAKGAASIEEAVSNADIVMTSLLDDHAVLEVAASMLVAMKQGAVVVYFRSIFNHRSMR